MVNTLTVTSIASFQIINEYFTGPALLPAHKFSDLVLDQNFTLTRVQPAKLAVLLSAPSPTRLVAVMPSSTDTPQATIASATSADTRPSFTSSTSPLLLLPGELRNRIYGYAFATESGIEYNAGPRPQFVPRGDDTIVELNQLQYTCRQLYEETAGLEVKVNQVNFAGKQHNSGLAERFLEFISTCTPKKVDWLRNVTLDLPDNRVEEWGFTLDMLLEQKHTMVSLGDFCHKHPLVHVRYVPEIFSAWTMNPAPFIGMGLLLSHSIRRKDLCPVVTVVGLCEFDHDEAIDWQKGVQIAEVPNLRFWSYNTTLPNEFAEELQRYWSGFLKVQACVDLVKGWLSDGI
jgi:hypothetical protein